MLAYTNWWCKKNQQFKDHSVIMTTDVQNHSLNGHVDTSGYI